MLLVKSHLISPARLYLRNIYVVINYATRCPLQYLQSNMGMLVVSPRAGNYRFWSHFWCSEGQFLRLQLSLRSMGKEIFIIKKSHCIELNWIQNSISISYLLVISNISELTQQNWQTLCNKRDNNFVWKNLPPDFTFL